MQAGYGVLSSVYGGFSDYIDITVQFWKASADCLLGTSASVSSVTTDTPAYGLKTADIASCTLIALSARAKLLRQRMMWGREEQELQIESKTLSRAVPARPLAEGIEIPEIDNVDVKVTQNNK